MAMIDVVARLTGNASGMVAAFTEAGVAAKKFQAQAETSGAASAAANEKLITSIGKISMAAGAAFLGAGAISVDMAMKFQKSTELLQTAGGMTQANLDKARAGILAISQSTGVAAEDLSHGMYIVSKVTKDAGDGLLILKAAAQGAVAEGVDMATMTTALTSVMTTYNLSAKDSVKTENALVVAAGASKTTMQEFAGSLSTVLPIAQSAHLGFDQVAGAIATMTQHGTSAQEATQELRNGIQALLSPNAVATKEMGQLGLSSLDVAQNLGKRGLTGTVQLLTEAVLSHSKGGEVLLGTFKQSQMAGQALNTMFGNMPPKLQELANKYINGSITMKDFNKEIGHLDGRTQNMGRQFEVLWKQTNGFSDALRGGSPAAQTFVGAMSKMMGGATGLQVAMMLGGDNMAGFQARVGEVGAAMKKGGTDIATNADTQKTLAQQIARTKASFEALMITIGTQLMPLVSDLTKNFSDFINFLASHQGVLQAVAVAVIAIGAAFAEYLVVSKAWLIVSGAVRLAVALLTGSFGEMSAAMDANPVGIVVVALTALVAGLIYAYNHVGWFKDAVDASWKFIQTAVKVVVDWFVHTALPWLVGGWDNLVKAWQLGAKQINDFFKAIGDIANWLWKTILKPVFDGIALAAKLLITIIGTVLITPWVIMFHLLGDVISFWWKNFVSPIFHWVQDLIGTVWKWLSDNVFKPMGDALGVLGEAFDFFWKHGVMPTWNGIMDVIRTVWDWISKNVFGPMKTDMAAVAAAFTFAWQHVIAPAWQGIQDGAKTAWNWIRDNAFNPLKSGIHAIGDAFDATQKFIGQAWDKIKGAASAPVKWIVDTVYTHGIEAVWNNIASSVGLDLKLPNVSVGFATGGIAPGWSPGRDNQVIAVSGGEAIMRPEWTAAVGADRVHAMNAMARSGNMSGIRSMMGYADGGIAGFFNNVAGNISSFVSNPLGGFMDLIKKPVDAMLAGIGGGNWGKMFAALPEKLVNTLMGHANPPSAPVSGGTGTFVAGGGAGGAQRWAGTVLQALNMVHQPAFLLPSVLRRMNQESGGNPNAINNWDSNAAMGDPSRGLMQTIGSTFAAYAMPGHNTNIYDPLSNILASMRYALSRYGSLANAYDRAGGYAMGGVVPARLYDQGGYLPTGTTLVQNNTGQPERVLAPGQTGMEGQTMVLEIPELGGRLKAYVTAVVNDHNAAVTRSLRNSAGIPKGGF